ncbi:MAG: fatty acid desaturase [Myxococcales bacterium]|nr:fatty acid desaturase [Myxococcales bacterium]
MGAKGFNWTAGSFFIAYHAVLLLTLPFYLWFAMPSLTLTLATVVIIGLCGVSLTTLYHRYYSHKTFVLRPAAEVVLLFFATLIGQGSAWEWAFDHRRHHKHTDTDDDPHDMGKGFWYAHVLWIFDQRQPLDMHTINDLKRSRLLAWQHRHYVAAFLGSSLLACVVLGAISGDWLGAFYMGFLVRLFISHHATFCINSLAHSWGTRPFDPAQSATNSHFCSFLTFGEGQHNYHHVFPHDYRIGDRWYYWDPGKWLIRSLAMVRLATRLKRAAADKIAAKRAEVAAWRLAPEGETPPTTASE